MTLIFSAFDTSTNFFAASDIVVSRQTDLQPEPIALPFASEQIAHRAGGYNLAGTRQKSVIFGRTLIMWAGWQLFAQVLIPALRAASHEGTILVDPSAIIESLDIPEHIRAESAFIYHHIEESGHLRRFCYNLDRLPEQANGRLAAGGTGVWNFFDNMVIDRELDNLTVQEQRTANFLTRIAMQSLVDFTSTHSLDFLYGGWFEVSFANPISFEKIPYAIRFWARSGDALASGGPIFMGWYNGDNLIVTRFNPYDTQAGVNIRASHFVVEDFLRRESLRLPERVITPMFVIHVVLHEDDRAQSASVVPYQESGMRLEIGPEGTRCAWTHEIRHRLFFGDFSGAPEVRLSDDV